MIRNRGGRPAAAPTHQSSGGNPTRARTPHCHAHCACCGRCFSSTRGFDGHRAGAFHADPRGFEGRHCVSPKHDERNRYEPAAGVCEIHGEPVPVDVWRLSEAIERARHRFGSEVEEQLAVAA